MTWSQFDDGSTVGCEGSEEGVIVLDEENELGARITLEKNGATAPFAITCGIYGWMVHTHFLGTETEARATFDRMKIDLERIIDLIPDTTDPDVDAKSRIVASEIAGFVQVYR